MKPKLFSRIGAVISYIYVLLLQIADFATSLLFCVYQYLRVYFYWCSLRKGGEEGTMVDGYCLS